MSPVERDALFQEPILYSFISPHNYHSPQLRSSPMKEGENIWSPSMQPHVDRTPTYKGVLPGSPTGQFMTTVFLLQCHAAFSTILSTLRSVDQSPISQRVSNPLQDTLHTCYCLPRDSGCGTPYNPEV